MILLHTYYWKMYKSNVKSSDFPWGNKQPIFCLDCLIIPTESSRLLSPSSLSQSNHFHSCQQQPDWPQHGGLVIILILWWDQILLFYLSKVLLAGVERSWSDQSSLVSSGKWRRIIQTLSEEPKNNCQNTKHVQI